MYIFSLTFFHRLFICRCPSSVISTKLFRPSVQPNLVVRERLLEKLSSGLNSKLTLISAPAGFGKTTLLTEWISKINLPAAWVSLDSGDNDPKRFLTYCVAALQTLQPDFGGNTNSLISSPQQVSAEMIVTAFLNEINADLKKTVLILDDYHLIESKSVNDAMIFFLDHLPLNLRLIIASRHDPPFPLSKMRVRKQLFEIRESDLRFTQSEAKSFFRETMELNLNEDDIDVLEDRTEGWVASLQLAGLAMQGRKNIHQFIKEFRGSHSYIVDYLTEEVLEHLDFNLQEFLLHTSILNKFNSQLCDAVTGGIESQRILDHLEKSKLFLVSLDEDRRWFRYHHLFADLLKYRLEQLFPEVINILHKRASEWFEKNGYTEDALNHALAAGDKERAADLIEAASIPTLVKGELITLQNWSEKIPSNLLSERANILIALAWSHNIRGELEKSEPLLVKVEKIIDKPGNKYHGESASELRGHIALIRSYNFSPFYSNKHANVYKQRELILKAKGYLEKDNPTLYSTINLILGWTYLFTGDWELGRETFENAQTYGEISGNHIVTLSGVYHQSVILLIQGKLKSAYNLCTNVIKNYTEKYGEYFLPLGFPYLGMGEVLYQMNRLQEAEYYLNNSLIISEMMGNWTMFFHAIYMLALIKQIKGDSKSVKDIIKKEEEALSKSPSYFRELTIETQKVRLRLMQKNIKPALKWMEKYNSDPMKESPYFLYGEIIVSRILMETGDHFSALNQLEKISNSWKESGAAGWLLEALILKAVIYKKEEEMELALNALKEALLIAEHEGYIRVFADEGKPMADLLTTALNTFSKEKNFNANYVSKLIDVINSEQTFNLQPLEEPLSDRELEVLHLLSAGYSNKDIADRLFVAIGTIKKHTHTIYQKLRVNSRTKAIQTARELNLI